MARYIDADKFYNNYSDKWGLEYEDTGEIDRVAFAISHAPTADVVEVKHGEWKRIECGTICTNCNRVYDNDFEFSYKQIKQYFKRCPDCGAKMDGGKANDL